MIKRANKGKLTGPLLKSHSLRRSFLAKKAAIRKPIKTFIGAGAIAMEKGSKIISQ